MVLTPHDEYLHLGYPRDESAPWKENYYFNYIDREADAMGIFHASIQRHAGIAVVTASSMIGGKSLTYSREISWPQTAKLIHNDDVIFSDGTLSFEVVEPFKKHRVTFEDGETSIHLDYHARFPEFLYEEEGLTDSHKDKALDATHYEQGMLVSGEISFEGKVREINCLGHRDHTWGFRDEKNLRGWNWIAVQFDGATWNFYKLRRNSLPDDCGGFVSYPDRNEPVSSVEVVDIRRDEANEPIVSKYRVTSKSGVVFNFVATRFQRMFLQKKGSPVVVHENFSEFIIEETGESGVGIDEHMEVS